MVADEDEAVCKSERSEARRESDLGCFIDNAIIEGAAGEERTDNSLLGGGLCSEV